MMRVLYIDHTAEIGGGEIALLNLVRHMDRACVDPMVLLLSDGPLVERLLPTTQTDVIALPHAVTHAKKDALGLSSILRLREVWLTVRHVFKVAAFIRSVKPDLVHTNSLKADIIGGLAGRLAGVPVIWHVRDRIDVDYLPSVVVHIFRLLTKAIPNYVIANSKSTLSTLHLMMQDGPFINQPVAPTQRYCVVHDGCDSNVNHNSVFKSKEERCIGLVGRISPWKGQDVFLRAAAEVLKHRTGIRFEIIGAPLFAEHEFEKHLHLMCQDLDIKHVVEFVGFVEDVPARLAGLDIFVHASTVGEPFGQVIIEAMAAGKPVIATNGGGVPEIVQDGVTGLLIPMSDPHRMAEAIIWLLEHPKEATSMGRAGRTRVREKFSLEQTAGKVGRVYSQVLAKR